MQIIIINQKKKKICRTICERLGEKTKHKKGKIWKNIVNQKCIIIREIGLTIRMLRDNIRIIKYGNKKGRRKKCTMQGWQNRLNMRKRKEIA